MNSKRIGVDTMFKTLDDKVNLVLHNQNNVNMILHNQERGLESMHNECCFLLKKRSRKGKECKRKCGKHMFCSMHRDSTQKVETASNICKENEELKKKIRILESDLKHYKQEVDRLNLENAKLQVYKKFI